MIKIANMGLIYLLGLAEPALTSSTTVSFVGVIIKSYHDISRAVLIKHVTVI